MSGIVKELASLAKQAAVDLREAEGEGRGVCRELSELGRELRQEGEDIQRLLRGPLSPPWPRRRRP